MGYLLLGCCSARAQDSLVVYFPFNQSSLSATDAARVDSLGRSGHFVTLASYCDSVGSDRYNDSLAATRAAAVRERLVAAGLADSLISVEVYGRRAPVNGNANEAERAANRRVLIRWSPTPVAVARPRDTTAIELKPSMSLDELFRDSTHLLGSSIILREVTFYGGRHYPEPSSNKVLENLLHLMSTHPGLSIEIQGFVCCLPDSIDALDLDTHIIDLSTARAKFIYDYLRGHGIDAARMRYRGFQASQKLYPDENSEEERKLNRRVQIKVTGWKP